MIVSQDRQGCVQLCGLCRSLGDPNLGLVILSEGNASGYEDAESFWVKASGLTLADAVEDSLVRVRFEPLLQAVDSVEAGNDIGDSEVEGILSRAVIEPLGARPSVEAFFHAALLRDTSYKFVAHTHPEPILSLVCTTNAQSLCARRLFPDEVVLCGPATCWVPYVDPGLLLALQIRNSARDFRAQTGNWAKTYWLQNHGLITLGNTVEEALNATKMAVKAATIWLGALSTGHEITTLSKEDVERIATRTDEHYRQRLLGIGVEEAEGGGAR